MSATTLAAPRIAISEQTIIQARDASSLKNSTLTLRTAEGEEVALPDGLQRVLLAAVASIADDGGVTIGRLPDELTSTVAADVLSISRPTLMKLAREGEIASFKVGTHTRFHRDEVLRVRELRARKRDVAINELRAFEEEHKDAFDD